MFINGIWLSTLKLWQAYHHWNEFNSPHSARTPRNEYYSKPYRENSYTPRGDVDIWESESVRHWIGAIKHTYNHMTWSHDLVLMAGCFCCVIHQTHCFVLKLEFCWILFSNWLISNLKWLHAFKKIRRTGYINFNSSSFHHVNVLQFYSTSSLRIVVSLCEWWMIWFMVIYFNIPYLIGGHSTVTVTPFKLNEITLMHSLFDFQMIYGQIILTISITEFLSYLSLVWDCFCFSSFFLNKYLTYIGINLH